MNIWESKAQCKELEIVKYFERFDSFLPVKEQSRIKWKTFNYEEHLRRRFEVSSLIFLFSSQLNAPILCLSIFKLGTVEDL